jgi:hypothetical protein
VAHEVAHGLSDRVSDRPDCGQAACGFEHLVPDMAALGAVTVEELFIAAAANYQRELLGKVECVLHAGVNAPAAGRAVDVCGISHE